MILYQYKLSCGHRKITPDRREVGQVVNCCSCEQRGYKQDRIITDVGEIGQIPVGIEEDTRG